MPDPSSEPHQKEFRDLKNRAGEIKDLQAKFLKDLKDTSENLFRLVETEDKTSFKTQMARSFGNLDYNGKVIRDGLDNLDKKIADLQLKFEPLNEERIRELEREIEVLDRESFCGHRSGRTRGSYAAPEIYAAPECEWEFEVENK